MILTKGQEKGLALARSLSNSSRNIGVIAGVAGTGKSSLIKIIAKELGAPIVVAPTGKAAARIRELGVEASTVHSWLYMPETDKKTGEVTFTRKRLDEISKGECNLLIIDESSMVNREMFEDIVEACSITNMSILCIGDPFQLPPVDKENKETFNLVDPNITPVSQNNYVLMTEILRQALESPIIRATMKIRAGDIWGALKDLNKVEMSNFIDKSIELQENGITICHKNTTRHSLNKNIRIRMGRGADTESGEPILIIKNNKDAMVFNGEVYNIASIEELSNAEHEIHDYFQKTKEKSKFGIIRIEDRFESKNKKVCVAMKELTGDLQASHFAIAKTADRLYKGETILHANLGYALSCHKAQGSEWDSVLVGIEPSIRMNGSDSENGRRWLYTALSRAKKEAFYSLGVKT